MVLCTCVIAQTLPVDGDFRSFQYNFLRRLINQGYYTELFENSRPYDVRDLLKHPTGSTAYSLSTLPDATKLDKYLLNAVTNALTRYDKRQDQPHLAIDAASEGNFADNSRTYSLESFYGHFFWQPDPKFAVISSFSFEESLADDPTYSGKVWNGLAGRINYVYLQFDLSCFRLCFGRDKMAWGPGRRGNLLLSSNSSAIDMIKISGGWGPFQYTTVTAVLDPDEMLLSYPDTVMPMRVNRYLSAHRLEIKPMRKLTLGFSESVVYGGVGRQLEIYYTNPLTWYHGEQLNKDTDDNTFLSFDFSFYPKDGISLYGEFLVDDLQIDDESKGDDEPNELGCIAGLYLTDPIRGSGLDISAEYTRINNWTYNQTHTWNRYVHDGKTIGHSLGPDRESIYLSLKKWFLWGGWALLSFEKQNIGEGNVFDDWTSPWLFSVGQYKENFPTGVVEKKNIYGLSLKVFRWRQVQIDFDNFYVDVKNKDNQTGNSDSYYQGRLTLKGTMSIF